MLVSGPGEGEVLESAQPRACFDKIFTREKSYANRKFTEVAVGGGELWRRDQFAILVGYRGFGPAGDSLGGATAAEGRFLRVGFLNSE